MKIDVDTQVIVTKEGGEQVIVDNMSSITISIVVMGSSFTIFKTLDEIVERCWQS